MITIKREKLYHWIWTKGLVKSASELGTTPGKLKNVLLQADIPLPNPQYWMMRQRENPLPRTPLPESELTVLEVPQKQLRQAKNLSTPEPSPPSNHHSSETKLEATYPPIFKEIELTNRSAIISAYQQLSVPSQLPKHLHPLIDQVYRVKKSEPVYYLGYSRPAPMLWFHSRYEKRTPAGALIIADALLEALASVGATVKLKNDDHNYRGRYDAEFELEGAEFELSCHVPTQKDNPSKDQWGRPTFSLTNELLRFAVTTSFTWSKSPITHKSDESETDYVKRIFIRIISLIPKGRREIAARKAQQKLFPQFSSQVQR
ncbi:hypothetical protein [Lacticaseibacillus salsurivasis]|uniref:hypothetical protein n=1 Tax=Lacticaseibacillus salsurivasis TaxID=3081441 RepID=UPI0030C71EC6